MNDKQFLIDRVKQMNDKQILIDRTTDAIQKLERSFPNQTSEAFENCQRKK